MGLKGRLFGRKDDERSTASSTGGPAVMDTPGCLHADLAERWDDAADMGKLDRVSGYQCRGCHESFTPEEGKRLQAENEVRLKATMGAR